MTGRRAGLDRLPIPGKPVRVALFHSSPLLREIVDVVISSAPGTELVATYRDIAELMSAVERAEIDVVILEETGRGIPAGCRPILERRPAIGLVAVGADGRQAHMYAPGPRRRPLGEVSPEGLVRAIVAAARRQA